MPRHVFLSPHLDDATLSCGGIIHHLKQQNEPVTILNVMAGDPPTPLPDTPLVRDLHARWQAGENPVQARRSEETAAAAALGSAVEFMTIPDCIYRMANDRALYTEGDDDLFGDIAPHDPALQILKETPLPEADYLYVPLGIGNHVDHQLVRDWVLEKTLPVGTQHAASLRNIWFYEDFPYAENEAEATRTLHLPELASLKLQPTLKRLTHADFEAKYMAIAHYRSQINIFWNDLDMMRSQVLAFMLKTGSGELSERYWRIPALGA